MDYRSRIEEALKENRKGVGSAAELARRTRIVEQTARAYVSGERNPPLDVCEDIGHALGYQARWLFEGIGPKLLANEIVRGDDKSIRVVPILDAVTAGKLAAPSSQIPADDHPRVSQSGLGPGEFFALQVSGTSMDRISPEGSTIIVNIRDRQPMPGKSYIFSVKGETTYKRWQSGDTPYLEPFSTDPTHKPIFVKRKRDVEIIGRVVRTILDL